jgi:L-histidine N-alpha-methyltransferase
MSSKGKSTVISSARAPSAIRRSTDARGMLTLVDAVPVGTNVDAQFRSDVLAGFAMRPQRAIPARWFYDQRGSDIFEKITRLPEYYPTSVEIELLKRNCEDIRKIVGTGRAVIEFGSGSSFKTPILLSCIEPAAYAPIDISGEFMRQSVAGLADAFPDLQITPIEADFMKPLVLPEALHDAPKLGFFPGSTIGNMVPQEATNLLRAMRETLGAGAMLLIGIDRLKDEETLVRAYDDSEGVTAAFNLNLLERINRELDGDIQVNAFRHVAFWNAWQARIEMHLQATRSVAFSIEGHRFTMSTGDTVHTENSHKYDLNGAHLLLRAGAWEPICHWTDPENKFAILLAHADSGGTSP